MTRRVAVYGGSFNPPHVCHQLAVTYLLATQAVDEVWVMPTPSHAFGKDLAPFEHRVAMVALALRHFGPRAQVSRLEEELPQPSRTITTLQAIRARHPDVEPCLVVGADILPETPAWKNWAEIVATTRLIVLGRTGYPAAGSVMLPEVSSTQVRELLATGGDATHLLDTQVLEYARRHGLYARR